MFVIQHRNFEALVLFEYNIHICIYYCICVQPTNRTHQGLHLYKRLGMVLELIRNSYSIFLGDS